MKRLFLLLFVSVLCADAFAQRTVVYPRIEGLRTSPDLVTTVNGREVWTEIVGAGGMEDLNVVNFSCEGPQTVTLTASREITNYKISPKNAGIEANVDGNVLTFTIDGPEKLYIKINDYAHLALFANPLEENPLAANARGVTYFGPGNHEPGDITLASGQVIYIAGGANVVANISGNGTDNVKIFGRGTLSGGIRVNNSDNFQVDGIFVRNNRGWTNTLTNCTGSSYNNVKVFSYQGVWGLDGINPVSCKTFAINDCFIRTRDDCIAIKSNGRNDAYDLSSLDISVTNSIMVGWDHADGVTLGFELNGGRVENILVRNCDILRARGNGRTGGHSAFSIVCDGPSRVSDIRFEDIRVEQDIEYKNLEIILTEGERYGDGRMGTIKGVHLKNVSWENAAKPFTIVGHPSEYVEDVTFTNCYVGGKLMTDLDDAQFQIEFARGIVFIPGGEAVRDRYPEQGVPAGTSIPGARVRPGQTSR